MFLDIFAYFRYEVLPEAARIAFSLWPAWLTLLTLWAALHQWLVYIRRSWINRQGSILLEIRFPREIPKSPAAMEFVLQGLWEPANISTMIDGFWEGKVREWFSLEIISIGGQVRFFIWAMPRWKQIIEARIYAQYPGAEVHEVKDYALNLNTGLIKKKR